MDVQVEKGGCSRGAKKTALHQLSSTTTWVIFAVLLTTILTICIFLYNMTKYMPILQQPKPKVRTVGEEIAH